MAHEDLKATYQPGQRWECMVLQQGRNVIEHPQWVPVKGEPLWVKDEDYRLAPTPTHRRFEYRLFDADGTVAQQGTLNVTLEQYTNGLRILEQQ